MKSMQTEQRYTYQEYLSWPEGEQYELVDGVAYAKNPAPSYGHQKLSLEIARQLGNQLLRRECQVFAAPFDVKLTGPDQDDAPTVVQPDIMVGCDPERFNSRGHLGAPDLIVEIVSPDSGIVDRKRKFALYEQHGVREYWIVDEEERVVEVYLLDKGGRYSRRGAYGPEETLSATAVSELSVDLRLVFSV